MKCAECGRELRKDSQFCDWCGTLVKSGKGEKTESRLNFSTLLAGIMFSIFITLLVTGIAHVFGIPLFFGGLFLPFFWWRIKKSGDKIT